ncbi:MAG: peptide deformylase [Candidatus Omnitrophica bacterium]|nr:peptide deformylase [Candidatus Omnitrophota bacterium]
MKETELKLVIWPNKILTRKCKPVFVVDEKIRQILDEMYNIMVKKNGIGLAANQVGLDKRLIVIGLNDQIFKLVNPCIFKKEGSIKIVEGCLSFPGLEIEVKRAKRIWVSALNHKGEQIDIEATDLLAVVLQHEIDHINGITFISRIPFWKKIKISSNLRKLKRGKYELPK